MEATLLISNIITNGAFIGTTAFFIKKWMDQKDRDDANIAKDLEKTVKDHKEELKANREQLDNGLKGIFDQLRIANGRTATLEGEVKAVKAVCAERHG